MKEFVQMAQEAIEMMPPNTRLQEEHKQVIADNKELLLAYGEEMVQAFYDTVYAHPQTKSVFHEGERPAREDTLRHFWNKTVEGPLDDEYFGWMAMVGLVHVVRKVENPMMIAMSSFLTEFIRQRTDNIELTDAFDRLSQTISAVVVYGFDRSKANALREIVGMEPALLHRLSQQEATTMLEKARQEKAQA